MVEDSDLKLFEQFVYNEAQLMDEHRYDEWLSLWHVDSLYWLPCNGDDIDPEREVSLIYENHEGIKERVMRLKSKFAHTQSPRTRLLRVVSSICLEHVTDSEICGSSVFVLGAARIAEQETWFGKTHHTLIRTDDGLKISRKKVFVLNNDMPMQNMTFLV